MSEIGVGLIGCGLMGLGFAKQVLGVNGRLKVRGIYDPDSRSVTKAVGELQPPPHVHDDYRELVARPDIDWVMVASWNCFHGEQVVAAFEAGKHVFCQKPLATTLADCQRMYQSWKSSGKLFNIGYTLRYAPHYRKLKQLLDEGAVGQIISMEFNETVGMGLGGFIHGNWRRLRKNAGSHLLEKCCHDIDLANWMVGARARRVASFGGLNFYRPENEYHMERLRRDKFGRQAYRATTGSGLVNLNPFTADKDIVDNQVAIIEYANGVRATFHTNCNAGIPERRMYIIGSEGTIRANIRGGIEVCRMGFGETIQTVTADAQGGHAGGDPVLAAELADSMLNHTTPKVGIREAVESAVTCFAIDDAMDNGTVVDLAPLWKESGLD